MAEGCGRRNINYFLKWRYNSKISYTLISISLNCLENACNTSVNVIGSLMFWEPWAYSVVAEVSKKYYCNCYQVKLNIPRIVLSLLNQTDHRKNETELVVLVLTLN